MNQHIGRALKKLGLGNVPHLTRIIVGIVGSLVLLVGIALIFLPGPAFVIIPAGLAILATEFNWARRWIDKAKDWVRKQRKKYKESRSQKQK